MKVLKKLLSFTLFLVIALASSAFPVYASPLQETLPSNLATQDMNELTARLAVNAYFAERLDFLTGDSEGILSAVAPILNDEFLHRDALINSNIHYISSVLTFIDINCWDDMAEVSVEETVIYTKNSVQKNCTITHKILLCIDTSGDAIIVSDGYVDSIINFESASYLPPATNTFDPMTLTGSNLCILHTAAGEVGYTETPVNITKYGKWYGLQDAWCAIFVAWCANEANIPTSVIPKYGSAERMKNYLSNQGRHYLSAAYGGSYMPVPGDLIFMDVTPAKPGHIGIVVSVNGNYVRIIDGNYSDKVCDRQISLTDTYIVGYGNPAYGSINHSSSTWLNNAMQHYKICDNCSCTFAHAAHTYTQLNPISPYVCSVCGYTRSGIEIEM